MPGGYFAVALIGLIAGLWIGKNDGARRQAADSHTDGFGLDPFIPFPRGASPFARVDDSPGPGWSGAGGIVEADGRAAPHGIPVWE